MPEFAPEITPISRHERRLVSVDCSGNLPSEATIAGAPSVSEIGTAHLTISAVVVNTEELVINDRLVPFRQAIQFLLDARGPNVRRNWVYNILITFDTDTGERVAGAVRVSTD